MKRRRRRNSPISEIKKKKRRKVFHQTRQLPPRDHSRPTFSLAKR
jgi:hypothetical protein